MPRIRTIKPEFWSDEKLGPLSPLNRLTFLGLIGMADDMGRLLDNVKQIDAFLFPYTDDTASGALATLSDIGRIERGVTAQGQRVIQISNWHHQKIEKPNVASALPPLAGREDETTDYRARKRVPQHLKDAVWARDGGRCRDCGRTPLRRVKKDRYDAGADLGEVDHEVEAADGGEPTLENLRLLCLPCNRKKSGTARRLRLAERSTEDQGRVGDMSATNPRKGGDVSPPLSTTGDRRPETGYRRPETADRAGATTALEVSLASTDDPATDPAVLAYRHYVNVARVPAALDQQLVAMHQGMGAPGGKSVPWPILGKALSEMLVASAPLTAAVLRAFVKRLQDDPSMREKDTTPLAHGSF